MSRLMLFLLFCVFCANNSYSQQNSDDYWNNAIQLRNAGEYQQAIDILRKLQSIDSAYYDDAEIMIQQIKSRISTDNNERQSIKLTKKDITLHYNTKNDSIEVLSNDKYLNIKCNVDWLDVSLINNKILVKCNNENHDIHDREALIKVYNEKKTETIRVVQLGSPEYLTIKEPLIELENNKETTVFINVVSNTEWIIQYKPDWCTFEIVDNGIKLYLEENTQRYSREGKLIITSLTKESELIIRQPAAQTTLYTSVDEISFSSDGGSSIIHVSSNTTDWTILDYPRWLEVRKLGQDTLFVSCNQNIPNGEIRDDNIQIKADNLIKSINVCQDAKEKSSVLFPEDKIISGRNISLGCSFLINKPIIHAKIGGSYLGSVVDYSYDSPEGNANYYDATMYGFGITTDLRLYKNIFIQLDFDFLRTAYKNRFQQMSNYYYSPGGIASTYLKGNAAHAYLEEYEFLTFELPVLLSWRWKINDVSHIKVFLGPSIQYGIKANLYLSGTTESKQMQHYYSTTHVPVDANYRELKLRTESSFNLYEASIKWDMINCTTATSEVPVKEKIDFASSPFNRINYSIQFGFGYEFMGIAVNLKYSMMMSNMANTPYWTDKRWTVTGGKGTSMSGYKQQNHYLSLGFSYVLRY